MNDPFEQFKANDSQETSVDNTHEGGGNSAGQAVDFEKLDDNVIFGHLSQKTGREIKSWEDLKQAEKEVVKEVPLSYASEEIGEIDKYVRETGRSVNDYIRLQKDWNQVADEEVAEAYLRLKHPEFDDSDVKESLSYNFGEEEIDEDSMDERTILSVKRRNEENRRSKKSFVAEARSYFEAEKEKYKSPLEKKTDAIRAGEAEWSKSMSEAIGEAGILDFGDFKYEINDKSKYDHLANLERLLDSFKENGVTNHKKLAKTIITGLEFENIMTEHSKFVEANTKEAIMKEYSNKGGEFYRQMTSSDVDDEVRKKENLKILKG